LPTYHRLPRFDKDLKTLSPDERKAFHEAVTRFVADLTAGGKFRKGLRVKGVKGSPGVFEMTWADDGRATFQYGDSIRKGEPHVIWRRVGGHEIFGRP
jgi:hypothetical protein